MHDLSVLANLNARKYHVRPVEYEYTTYSRADGGGLQDWATKYEVWELLQDRARYVTDFRYSDDADHYTQIHRHF